MCPKLGRNQVSEALSITDFNLNDDDDDYYSFSQYASCTDDCSSDGDCPGETEKCCYNGCGR